MCRTIAQNADPRDSTSRTTSSHRATPLVVSHYPNDRYHASGALRQACGKR